MKPTSFATRCPDLGRLLFAASATLVLAIAPAACAGVDDAPEALPAADGSVADGTAGGASAERGKQLSQSSGCAGCHGADFDGGAGPGWIGLAGSEVTLTDGSTVTADDDYLTRAIVDPSAELVEGYTLKMPANNLSDAEVADIVAFINTLAAG